MTGNATEAEDVLQEATLKAYRFYETFRPGTNFRAWIHRVLYTVFVNSTRDRGPRTSNLDSLPEQERYENELIAELDRPSHLERQRAVFEAVDERIKDAIMDLPPDLRMVFMLSTLEGLKYREIAEVMDCPLGTVMSRLFRSRRMLQEKLVEYARETGFKTEARSEVDPVNCQECRTYLHPYLDGELDVPKNLAILEHLNACAGCQEVFDGEERAWSRVRAVAVAEQAPEGFADRIHQTLAREEWSQRWRTAGTILIPLAAAAIVLAIVLKGTGKNSPSGPFDDHGHSHGPGVHWAVNHFEDMNTRASNQGTTILDEEFLDAYEYRTITSRELPGVIKSLFGKGTRVAPRLNDEKTRAARLSDVQFEGFRVENLLLQLKDVDEIGIYRLPRDKANVEDLKTIREADNLKIARCRSCHVITVERHGELFILVSKNVQSMIDLMRQTL